MKSSSTSSPNTPTFDRTAKPIRSMVIEPVPKEKVVRSKEEEAEDAAELQQEIDQLLTSLNLEKPPLTATSPSSAVVESPPEEKTSQLETVVRTLYDIQKPQMTIVDTTSTERRDSSSLIDRLLTARAVQIPKYSSFNPFPSRSFNENVAVNGYKLGLYAPDPSTR